YDEAFFAWVVQAGGRHHLYVGIAVFEIETPDQIAIGLDAVWIVDVRCLQEAHECGFGGLDYLLQTPRRVGIVADENNGFDAVFSPSLISKTRSTRLFGRSIILGTTVTSKRPLR